MVNLIEQIFVGVIVAALASWFGFGRGRHAVYVQGVKVKRTGKWMIIISFIIIVFSLILMINQNVNPNFKPADSGFVLFSFGALLLIIGRVVAWFQKL